MPDKKYSRVEEEILQILDKMDDETPAPSQPPVRLVHSRPTRKRRPAFRMPRLALPSATATLGLVIACALAALVTNGILQMIATVATVVTLILLFIPRKHSVSGSTGAGGTKRWRGRDISFNPDDDTPVDRARRWFDHRRGQR